MESLYDRNVLEASLSQMESQALNFAQRFINDSQVRMSYIKQTKKLSEEYRLKFNLVHLLLVKLLNRYKKCVITFLKRNA